MGRVLAAVAVAFVMVSGGWAAAQVQSPSVSTGDAVPGISAATPAKAGAFLTGTIDDHGTPARYVFEFGPTAAYGERSAEASTSGNGREEVGVGIEVNYESTYHYRLVALTSAGAVPGEDRSVTVPHLPLRPTARVQFITAQPLERSTVLQAIKVLDAPRGSTVSVDRCRGRGGTQVCTRLTGRRHLRGKDVTVLGRRRVASGAELRVTLDMRVGSDLVALAQIRSRRSPRIRELCRRGPFSNPCAAVGFSITQGRIRHLSVVNLPNASLVEVACRGQGCPRRRLRDRIATDVESGEFLGTARFGGVSDARPGAVIDVYATRRGSYGFHRRLTVKKAGVLISGYRCVALGSRRRFVRCP